MTHRAVAFDLDDTLYDYEAYAAAGLRSAADRLEAETGKRYHEELARLYFEAGVTDGTFDRLLADNDLPPSLADELVDAFHASSEPLDPFPSTDPVLSQIGEEARLGLVTDGRGGHAKLERLGIRDRFDEVVVTPTIDATKHDPAVFEQLLAALSVSPSEAAYVGDDPRVDFRVPNQLGMTTVRVPGVRYEGLEASDDAGDADHEISHLAVLPDVL